MTIEKMLIDMPLHSEIEPKPGLRILRVPGGWVHAVSSDETISCCFNPGIGPKHDPMHGEGRFENPTQQEMLSMELFHSFFPAVLVEVTRVYGGWVYSIGGSDDLTCCWVSQTEVRR